LNETNKIKNNIGHLFLETEVSSPFCKHGCRRVGPKPWAWFKC